MVYVGPVVVWFLLCRRLYVPFFLKGEGGVGGVGGWWVGSVHTQRRPT